MDKFTADIRIRDLKLEIQRYLDYIDRSTNNKISCWWYRKGIESMENRIKELNKIPN